MKIKVDIKGLRSFGLIFSSLLFAFLYWLIPWLWQLPTEPWALLLSPALAVIAVLAPARLDKLFRIWMKLGLILSWVNTRILLGILFLFVFVPVSTFFRIMGKDPLTRRFDGAAKSYRVVVEHSALDHMEKPY